MSVPYDAGDDFASYDYAGDPDAQDTDLLIEEIRNLLHEHAEHGYLTEEQSDELVAAVDLLDDLLASGRPLPQVWRRAGLLRTTPDPAKRPVNTLPPL